MYHNCVLLDGWVLFYRPHIPHFVNLLGCMDSVAVKSNAASNSHVHFFIDGHFLRAYIWYSFLASFVFFSLDLIFIYLYVCLCICHMHAVPEVGSRGLWFPCSWSKKQVSLVSCLMWMPGSKPETLEARASSRASLSTSCPLALEKHHPPFIFPVWSLSC